VTEPLRLSFEVKCSPEHAFQTWTARLSRWWPSDHTVTGESDVDIVIEGRIGGRIFERTRAGAEHDWGQITVWEPPRRLAYQWFLRRDRSDATQVEIVFVDQGATTRVDIEHTGWERLGARGPERRRGNQAGWAAVLPHYVNAIEVNAIEGGAP
jgi:uncharacterized protein YndB with AHSA1/START domain